MVRPDLNDKISRDDFKNYYWLKSELVCFCRDNKIPSGGSKIDISKRIEIFLSTGEITALVKRAVSVSEFNWKNEVLSLNTIVTDNYKNNQNVRNFFISHIGNKFKFNVMFMNWMKENTGKTLKEAVKEWERIHILLKDKNNKTEIAPQFEYNRYIRDFLADNPGLTRKEAIKYWKIKRSKPGSNKYSSDDIK